jgi:hypothetical protein
MTRVKQASPFVFVVTLIAGFAVYILGCTGADRENGSDARQGRDTPAREPQPVVAAPDDEPVNDRDQNREAAPRDARATSPGFSKLKGKWIRTDGGYIVDIKRVDEHGKMDAAYLNPSPIHVAKAEASQEGAATKVFIELRDVNYPGSTYELVYDPQRDQLTGVYFQAVQQQHFDVTFDRRE